MSDPALIHGGKVVLRAATPDDRQPILDWLLRSDVTPTMLGPPLYPERPIPPPEQQHGGGYEPHYFDGSAPELGRCFLILADGEPAGQVSYNDIHTRGGRRRVELDIWMRSEAYCGKGYGTDALDTLCRHLHERFGVVEFLVQPSARNPRAIRAYEKAGFARLDVPAKVARELWGPSDYADSVYMVMTILSGAGRSIYERMGPLPQDEDAIPEGIRRSQDAFFRDLPSLLENESFRGQWVAYRGDERVMIGPTQDEVIAEINRRGIKNEEFDLFVIEPQTRETEEVPFPSLWR